MRRYQPPHVVFPKEAHAVGEEVLLPPPQLLFVVNIGLIIFHAFQLFLDEFVSKDEEEDAFHKCQYRQEECIAVELILLVLPRILIGQQEVKAGGDQTTQNQARDENVNHELDEVFVVPLAHTVVNPRTVMVHL